MSTEQETPYWYKDAIIYETHVKAFCDSNGDGIGDFRGLIGKLDYLQNLGVTAIWLLPFYPSPLKDDGYDIADYYDVNPSFGTLKDFKELLREAHRRDLRVITELVLNHTSDQNAWFQESRLAPAGSPARELYVWSDTPEKYADARIIFKDFETSNWSWDPVAKAYYWHRFYSHQPDLNFENPRVHQMLFKVIDFWLAMGVDGLRLDAVPYLYEAEGTNCENLAATHAFLRKLRTHMDAKFPGRMLLAEANQWPEDAAAYFGEGDSCHMNFHFPLMPRMFMALQMEDRFPILDILDQTPAIPDSCQWAIFLRNHDELTLEMVTDEERDYMVRVYAADPRARINLGIRRRLAPLLRNNRRKIELINILLFSLPGTPIIYYGDEIGMGDNIFLGDRNGVRTPMQWSSDRNAGFSSTNPQQLFLPITIDPEYHYETVNAENQERNASSLLWWMRRVIAMRKSFKAFGRGTIEFLTPDNPKALVFLRAYEEQTILVVVNLSRFSQVVEVDLAGHAGKRPREAFSHNEFPIIKDTPYLFTLGPYDHYWLVLESEHATPGSALAAPALLPGAKNLRSLLAAGPGRTVLEKTLLPMYLPACRWFGGKARVIRSLAITDSIPLEDSGEAGQILVLRVTYTDGDQESYVLPVQFAIGEPAHAIRQEFPQSVIAASGEGDSEAILFDAIYDVRFRDALMQLVLSKRAARGKGGELTGDATKALRSPAPTQSVVLRAEQSNSSLLYNSAWFLKLFRRLEEGLNPDLELTKHLSEHANFSGSPAYAGSLVYTRPKSEPCALCLVQEAVANQGDAWTLSLDVVGQFFEHILAERPDFEAFRGEAGLHLLDGTEISPDLAHLVGGFYLERARMLGERTAELHKALTADRADPRFAPEPFSVLYQRSIYQSARNSLRRTFQSLARAVPRMTDESGALAAKTLGREKEILAVFGRLLGEKIAADRIRIHGDLHLGQALYTGKDFILIDFEGEPARPLSERRLKRTGLRDVGGMLRSFHYSAYTALLQRVAVRGVDVPTLEPWAELWIETIGRVYLKSYIEASAGARFVPPDRAHLRILLDTCLLDQTIYEIGYELNNRPDWIGIPLSGLDRILARCDEPTP